MRALVTGGAGLIGSHLSDLLITRGYAVRIFDNLEPSVHQQRPYWIPSDTEFFYGDMRNPDDLRHALQDVDLIFHQAAYGGCVPNIEMTEVNTLGTARLFDIIRTDNLPIRKIVTASSQAIYGEGKYKCKTCGVFHPNPRPIAQMKQHDWEVKCPICLDDMAPVLTDESVHPIINSIYALTKYSEEIMTLNFGKTTGIPTVALRYTLTYGPHQSVSNPYTGICSIFSTRLLNDLQPVIYEDGLQTRDFVFVGDVASANLAVMESDAANGRVFNVGTGKPTSIMEFAKALASALGKDIEPTLSWEFRPMDYRHLVADASALRSIGWAPEVSLNQGIEAYVRWIQSLPKPQDQFSEAEQILRQRKVVMA